ncbi:MAG: DHH family phosphoesterase [Chitinophagales bacterium]|nr:DHH family phosphoesterase [Chitinophagales bacterium]
MIENIDSLKELLTQPRKITITAHQRPDGDAMGSTLALSEYLSQFGHEIKVILPTEYPFYFEWMPGAKDAWVYPEHKEAADEWIKSSDLICCLDFNTLSRIEPMDAIVKEAEKPILLLDHHLQPDTFEWMLHDVKACSTCELVHRFINLFDAQAKITEECAQCIYTGILTDTGGFSNGATNKAAFDIVADLMDRGLDILYVQQGLNQNKTESRLRFLGNALLNEMVVNHELGIAFVVVNRKDAKKYNLQTGDTEGLVNYPLSIKGIEMSVLIKEEKSITKLSFRSKGDINVNEFARVHFEGGGHKNAAGGKSIYPPKWLINKITELVKKSKN